jgi:dTDP-glucose pyrophosphorylase
MEFNKHIILQTETIKVSLAKLNELASDAILFVVDTNGRLIGSLTDGDIRRGLLKDKRIDSFVSDFIEPNPKFINKKNYSIQEIIEYKKNNFKIIPIVDDDMKIVNIINFRLQKSYLPIDAILMAGGKGERLRPLTLTTPKPLLLVGNKPIIEHNIDNLIKYGIDDFQISIKYLGDQIEAYFKDGKSKNVFIDYINETEPLGTIGAAGLATNFQNEYILITNSDLLTDVDYEDYFLEFIEKDADVSVVTIPYQVNVPYAIFDMSEDCILALKEKPTYNYYSNGGIYLIKKELLNLIPKNVKFNATDFLEKIISENKKVVAYSHQGYWLDIGQPDEYKKAQEDIKHLKF